ncbi:DUF418 domain-containing protein [Saccharothrix violaceirubra]|uniref:DUF418 domain-containing protein n=1 Tax=Saccharothrix violaceirubra TaxID=413306 RepID=A0A7W7T4E4_9PSEU|nr:DUF418 domain-containing protein [Saccharothrix violaceirubra]MBB4966389.1 uncharacterized protein [Saccharothrix violaceirubra]
MTASVAAIRNRVQDLDAVRGLALLGIFIVNITFMSSGYPGNLVTDPEYSSVFDNFVRGLSSVFIDMKFYMLFSFLFGYSFTLQLEAAKRAGAAFGPRMLRRIGGLFVLGALHTAFLYGGDVLTTYAVACLVLFWMRNASDRTALRVAAIVYGVVLLIMVASGLFVDSSTYLPGEAEALANGAHATQAMLGGWGDVIDHNLGGLVLLIAQAVSFQGPASLALFLLGMVAGRRRLLANVRGDEPILRRLQLIGYPIGIAGGLAFALGGGAGTGLASAASVATAPLLTAAYVATLLRMMHSPRTEFLRDTLAPAGRIALTNYLGQSVVGLVLFTGVGFGLAGSFSPAATMGLAVLVFAGQVAASAWWLRHHQYGPAEWVLRWVTNARRPAWRKAEAR